MWSRLLSVALVLGAASRPAHASPLDKVRDLCSGLHLEQRPELAITDVTDQVRVPTTVEDRFSAMLSTAILNSGCFGLRSSDTADEARYALAVTLTEYTESTRDAMLVVNGEKLKVTVARFTLILQLTDRTTGEMLVSEVFESKKKSTKGRVQYMSAAMESAIEAAVADVVDYLAPYQGRLVTPASEKL